MTVEDNIFLLKLDYRSIYFNFKANKKCLPMNANLLRL